MFRGAGFNRTERKRQALPFLKFRTCAGRRSGFEIFAFYFWCRSDDATTRLLDLFLRRGTYLVKSNSECLFDFAVSEEFDLVAWAVHETCLTQGRLVEDRARFEAVVEIPDVDDDKFIAEVVVVEAALRKTAVKRHLAAFESNACAGSGTGFLTLVAFSGGLTESGAFTGAETLGAVLGTRVRVEIVEFHSVIKWGLGN